ncbi:tyrosine-type recombinase/integrase [Streptomyces sp. NPDC002611]
MTTSSAGAVALPQTEPHRTDLWDAIKPEFLTTVDWDDSIRVIAFPQDHPVLGWQYCQTKGCLKPTGSGIGLCAACFKSYKNSDVADQPVEVFLRRPKQYRRSTGEIGCAVQECARRAKTERLALCPTHLWQQQKGLQLPLQEFLAHPSVKPLESIGPCVVVACTRQRYGRPPYCPGHSQRLALNRRADPSLHGHEAELLWRRTTPAVAVNGFVSLRGIHDTVAAEILVGMQARTEQGLQTRDLIVRPLADTARRLLVSSLEEIDDSRIPRHQQQLRNSILTAVKRVGLTPETERHKDVWDASVFGLSGTLRFGVISQSWLREALRDWAHEDLPQRRGNGARGTVQDKINAIGMLSESLRLQRDDQGDVPANLGRTDIVSFLHRMSYLVDQGTITENRRHVVICAVRFVLTRTRSQGLTRPGRAMHRLPDDFTVRPADIPDPPEDSEVGRDLPIEVVRALCEGLPALEAQSGVDIRTTIELIIDTGRRPEEICTLFWDCLERDEDGKPVLIYDNHKANRMKRRLPISEATAGLIVKQQERIRERFPEAKTKKLRLLPSLKQNIAGTRPSTDEWAAARHRVWVDALPDIVVPTQVIIDGKTVTKLLPFDKTRIFPYAYRHTYAQRHADAGVPPDVLRVLMDHRQLSTTQGYYRVGEKRRREAVDRVSAMQFDRNGNRIWRTAQTLLDSEHARRAIGETAVPYGVCTEPGNVAAGGQDCPVRFRCVGCGHFRTDVSYLPDLEAYLAHLLRSRERLMAAIDADDWARTEAMPSDEEISRVKRLISRVKGNLDDLDGDEKQEILEATAIVRRQRQRVVGLGMPRVGQPIPDIRPDRTA